MKLIPPLHSDDDYERALAEIERYFDKEPEPGTREATRFDALAALIAAYEAKHEPTLTRSSPSTGPAFDRPEDKFRRPRNRGR